MLRILQQCSPTEIYNLAAQSHVSRSFTLPGLTLATNGQGPIDLFECVRLAGLEKSAKIYQASSSEMFGNRAGPLNEDTPFQPVSPYGSAKLVAHWAVAHYRQAYGMFIVGGISFNHESPRRGEHFGAKLIRRRISIPFGS